MTVRTPMLRLVATLSSLVCVAARLMVAQVQVDVAPYAGLFIPIGNVVDQTEIAINEIVPRPAVVLQAALQEGAVNGGQWHV